jgi:two-component system, LytTR family, sensor kinase
MPVRTDFPMAGLVPSSDGSIAPDQWPRRNAGWCIMLRAMTAEPDPSNRLRLALLSGWCGFWLLMIAVGVQEELRRGQTSLWRPIFYESTSALVATGLAWWQWHAAQRLDPLLARPLHWFARLLVWVPLLALGFVGVVYGLRHAVHALIGTPYRHEPWAQVIVYEALKFTLFYLLFSAVQFGVRSYLAWHGARLNAERQARFAQQARLTQLTQQLQPHFLFNALNTVSALIHTDPDRADALLTQLAALLRAATDVGHDAEQPLADELALLRGYAAIMTQRFDDRARVEWDIAPEALACRCPTLGLQPLLENSFRHAVEMRRAATRIVVRAACSDGRLRIEVEDDGPGVSASAGFGVGLGNLQGRLDALHGPRARVALQSRAGGGALTVVELPCGC